MKKSTFILTAVLLFAAASVMAQYTCGTSVKDYDGNTYKTVQIGSQCWMAENLRTMHFPDGTTISRGSSLDYNSPWRFYPDNNMKNVEEYGMLYNWPAAMKACPRGWHLPNDAEWNQLTKTAGDKYGCNGEVDDNAKALAATKKWKNSNNACQVGWRQSTNNATGFSALPAGDYNKNGYSGFGETTCFWSATAMGSEAAICRYLSYDNLFVLRIPNDGKGRGLSVRCLRD